MFREQHTTRYIDTSNTDRLNYRRLSAGLTIEQVAWFERSGRNRIGSVNSWVDVADYCAKYRAREDLWWGVKLLGHRHLQFQNFKLSNG